MLSRTVNFAWLNKTTTSAHKLKAGRIHSATPKVISSKRVNAISASIKDDILIGLSGATTPTNEDRLMISELLPKLEASNPQSEPAYSPLLDGEWEMLYTGGVSPGPVASPTREIALLMYAGGFTPGMLLMSIAGKLPDELLILGKPTLHIGMAQPRVVVKVPVTALGRTVNLTLRNNLESESAFRMREIYSEAEFEGRTISLPDPLKWERLFFITYLDETTLVVRDETGAPDVLVRKSPVPEDTVYKSAEISVDDPIDIPVETEFVKTDGPMTSTDYNM